MLNEKIRRLVAHGFEVYYIDELDCFSVHKGKYLVLLEIDQIYEYKIDVMIDMINDRIIDLYLEDKNETTK
jgi:hypothetical protein